MSSGPPTCLDWHYNRSGHIVVLRDRVQRFSSIPTRCVTQTLSRCAAHKGTGFHFPEKEMNWGQLMISETLPGSETWILLGIKLKQKKPPKVHDSTSVIHDTEVVHMGEARLRSQRGSRQQRRLHGSSKGLGREASLSSRDTQFEHSRGGRNLIVFITIAFTGVLVAVETTVAMGQHALSTCMCQALC